MLRVVPKKRWIVVWSLRAHIEVLMAVATIHLVHVGDQLEAGSVGWDQKVSSQHIHYVFKDLAKTVLHLVLVKSTLELNRYQTHQKFIVFHRSDYTVQMFKMSLI